MKFIQDLWIESVDEYIMDLDMFPNEELRANETHRHQYFDALPDFYQNLQIYLKTTFAVATTFFEEDFNTFVIYTGSMDCEITLNFETDAIYIDTDGQFSTKAVSNKYKEKINKIIEDLDRDWRL